MTRSKTEEAYLLIKEKIISGELAPGKDIFEESLQKELGVSRTPIREATQLLQKEGFVNVFPRKGIIVTDITISLLNELFDVRALNEPYIARMCVGRVPDSFWLDLKARFLNRPGGYTFEQLEKYYSGLDEEFHNSQLNYCSNRFIIDTMHIISDHEKRIRRLTFNLRNNDDFCVNEHVEMIDLFLQREPAKLAAAAYAHVESARKLVFSHFYNNNFTRNYGETPLSV